MDSHVGWNPNTDVPSEDAQLKSLFQKAGVSEEQLQDKETREFIYDFIHKHASIDTTLESERDPPVRMPHQKNLEFSSKQEFSKKERKRNITKDDIGTPMDFIHISHVDRNPNRGLDIWSEDAQLKSLFQKAGVSEKQLQDKETREFIYDFIHKHGGIDTDALESETSPLAVPPREPPAATKGLAPESHH